MTDLMDALKYKLKENANENRSNFQTSRWKVDRVSIELSKFGFHDKQISKCVGTEWDRAGAACH